MIGTVPTRRDDSVAHRPRRALALGLLLSASAVSAQKTHLVVVSGAGGQEEYREQFHEWGSSIVTAALDRYSLAEADVTWLAERPDRDPRIDGPSRRDDVQSALTSLASSAGASDVVVLVLIGHGSFHRGGVPLQRTGPGSLGR